MHILSLIFGLMIAIVVVGFIASAWVLRAILFRKARANGWTPPRRSPGLRGSYDQGGQFQVSDPGHRHGGHHGGWGGVSGGGHGSGHHGGGHHGGGGGGDAGGGGHHH